MADKVTIDFEKELVTWETNNQQGTEVCPGISNRKSDILKAMGYESVNFSPVINLFNSFVNGEISKEDFLKSSEEYLSK